MKKSKGRKASKVDMKKSKGRKASKVDMISKLPDHILHLILSRLPSTKEASQTSILSRRWRNVWTSAPSIDIDCSRGNKFHKFVFHALANKSVDLDRFHLCCLNLYNMSTVKRWLDAAVKRNVKQLDLRLCTAVYKEMEVPNCVVNSRSLEVLRLCLFGQPLIFPKFTGFPALRVLELNDVDLRGNERIKDFFESCPLLEDLSLVGFMTYKLDLLCISCQKLKNLRFDNRIDEKRFRSYAVRLHIPCRRLQICCPKLAILELSSFMAKEFIFQNLDSLKKVVVHPSREFSVWADNNLCELFAGFSHVESLSLDISTHLNLEDFPESLPNLKKLELTTTMDGFNMDVVIRILVCSPNLESLDLIIKPGVWYTSFPPEDHDCIFERLKIVKMRGMSGAPLYMRFIEFLLERSPALETMSITPSVNMTTDERLSFSIELQRFREPSLEAKIIFVQGPV